MISKTLLRASTNCIRLVCSPVNFLVTPKYNFAREVKKNSLKNILNEEISSQEKNIVDVSELKKQLSTNGWKINQDGTTLIEFEKNIGQYNVKILSNIKAPALDQENQDQQKEAVQQEQPNNDFNQITVAVTRSGQPKIMIFSLLVHENVELSNIYFTDSYESLKKNRFDVIYQNRYLGPEIETLSDDLHENIMTFLEEDLTVNTKTLQHVADYCADIEQVFYIQWLKDLRQIV